MTALQAGVLRRMGLLGSALAVTYAAHAAATNGAAFTGYAPLIWLALMAAAALTTGRGDFTPRRYRTTLTISFLLQITLHVAMVLTPWAAGIATHHHVGPPLDARALLVHGAAAVVLAWLLHGGERALAGAVAAVARLLRSERRRGGVACWQAVDSPVLQPPTRRPPRAAGCRGPPPRVAPACGCR